MGWGMEEEHSSIRRVVGGFVVVCVLEKIGVE